MATDTKFEATLLTSGGADNWRLVNEILARIGATVSVKNRTTSTPPGSPADFDAYIIGSSPTGDWTGRAGEVTFAINSDWYFIPVSAGGGVPEGFRCWIEAEDMTVVFDGTEWRPDNNGHVTLSDSGGAVAWDLKDGLTGEITLDGNHTLSNPTNVHAGDRLTYIIKQDGTGSRVPVWDTAWEFAGGTAPTLSTGSGAVDVLTFVVESSSEIYCTGYQLNLS